MMRAAVLALLVANEVANGDSLGLCACVATDPKYPFTIDCSNAQAIRSATDVLESDLCEAPRTDKFEWAGTFATPADSYIWVSQAATADQTVASKVKYADDFMTLVAIATSDTTATGLFDHAATANTLMSSPCTPVKMTGTDETGRPTIVVPATTAGVCVTIEFPRSDLQEVDFVMDVNTQGVDHLIFYTAHGPTEFERSVHYFQKEEPPMGYTNNTDIEPIATNAEFCKYETNAQGVMDCQQAFLVIQAHHDYCPHDTLTPYEEELFHEWESKCDGCAIVRRYDSTLNNCAKIDCASTQPAVVAYSTLTDNCVPKDFGLPFEWAASFDLSKYGSKPKYTWISQAATPVNASGYGGDTFVGTQYEGNFTYGNDAGMLFVAFAQLAGDKKSKLRGQQDAAVALMSNKSNCPDVHSGYTITPTVTGACVSIVFPTGTPNPMTGAVETFNMTLNTVGETFIAIFTEHVPTEFERSEADGGVHYLMDFSNASSPVDVEPTKTLGTSAGHDHSRRLSEETSSSQRRRLHTHGGGQSGQCCTLNGTAPYFATPKVQQNAWQIVVSYHDQCPANAVPYYIETGFHQYEDACEDYFCNNLPQGCTEYDCNQLICPSPPPPPPLPPPTPVVVETVSKDELDGGALAGIIIASVVAVLLLAGMAFVVSREVQGKPIFMTMSDVDKANVRTGGDAVGTDNAA